MQIFDTVYSITPDTLPSHFYSFDIHETCLLKINVAVVLPCPLNPWSSHFSLIFLTKIPYTVRFPRFLIRVQPNATVYQYKRAFFTSIIRRVLFLHESKNYKVFSTARRRNFTAIRSTSSVRKKKMYMIDSIFVSLIAQSVW